MARAAVSFRGVRCGRRRAVASAALELCAADGCPRRRRVGATQLRAAMAAARACCSGPLHRRTQRDFGDIIAVHVTRRIDGRGYHVAIRALHIFVPCRRFGQMLLVRPDARCRGCSFAIERDRWCGVVAVAMAGTATASLRIGVRWRRIVSATRQHLDGTCTQEEQEETQITKTIYQPALALHVMSPREEKRLCRMLPYSSFFS